MTEASFIRISLKGTNDSYMAFAEEKERKAKMITYVLGGWGNNSSTVRYLEKESTQCWHGHPHEPYTYSGKVHNGQHEPVWLELNWHVEGKEGMMEISKIKNEEGEGKQVMSSFPVKDHKLNWLFVTSGCSTEAEWKVITYY